MINRAVLNDCILRIGFTIGVFWTAVCLVALWSAIFNIKLELASVATDIALFATLFVALFSWGMEALWIRFNRPLHLAAFPIKTPLIYLSLIASIAASMAVFSGNPLTGPFVGIAVGWTFFWTVIIDSLGEALLMIPKMFHSAAPVPIKEPTP